jgi:hypothetical protein
LSNPGDKGRSRLNKIEVDDGGFAVVWKPASETESPLIWVRASIAEHTIVQRVWQCYRPLNAQTSSNKAVSALVFTLEFLACPGNRRQEL